MQPRPDSLRLRQRASWLFCVLIALFFASTGGSLYEGWQTGELKKRVIEPVKNILAEVPKTIAKIVEESPPPTPMPFVNSVTNVNIQTVTSDSNETVKVQRRNNGQNYRVEYVYPTAKPQTQTTSMGLNNDYFKEVEERSRQSREASLRWFEEARSRNAAQFEVDKAKMKADSDAWVQKMQAEAEQWKKEHGF